MLIMCSLLGYPCWNECVLTRKGTILFYLPQYLANAWQSTLLNVY